MERGDKLARTVRLLQIQRLLFEEPLGLTTRQLAELCGVSQRTIQRDLLALHDMQVPVAQKGDRYSILQSYILPPITFSLYEALALFLASRLILRQTRVIPTFSQRYPNSLLPFRRLWDTSFCSA